VEANGPGPETAGRTSREESAEAGQARRAHLFARAQDRGTAVPPQPPHRRRAPRPPPPIRQPQRERAGRERRGGLAPRPHLRGGLAPLEDPHPDPPGMVECPQEAARGDRRRAGRNSRRRSHCSDTGSRGNCCPTSTCNQRDSQAAPWRNPGAAEWPVLSTQSCAVGDRAGNTWSIWPTDSRSTERAGANTIQYKRDTHPFHCPTNAGLGRAGCPTISGERGTAGSTSRPSACSSPTHGREEVKADGCSPAASWAAPCFRSSKLCRRLRWAAAGPIAWSALHTPRCYSARGIFGPATKRAPNDLR
jgi:hypothetical protein